MAGIVEGKVAIVTGGGGAIGGAISRLLAKEGAKVVVNDVGGSVFGTDQNDLGPAQKVVADIKAAGGQAIANGDSVSSWESAQKIVQARATRLARSTSWSTTPASSAWRASTR